MENENVKKWAKIIFIIIVIIGINVLFTIIINNCFFDIPKDWCIEQKQEVVITHLVADIYGNLQYLLE